MNAKGICGMAALNGKKPSSVFLIIVICTFYVLIILPAIKRSFADRDSACARIESAIQTKSPLSSLQGVSNQYTEKSSHAVHVNPRFYLYRLIGNNMPPLQCFGQLLKNTRYALDQEPPLADCKKLWVLNNIVNATERALILDLLLSRGYTLQVTNFALDRILAAMCTKLLNGLLSANAGLNRQTCHKHIKSDDFFFEVRVTPLSMAFWLAPKHALRLEKIKLVTQIKCYTNIKTHLNVGGHLISQIIRTTS